MSGRVRRDSFGTARVNSHRNSCDSPTLGLASRRDPPITWPPPFRHSKQHAVRDPALHASRGPL